MSIGDLKAIKALNEHDVSAVLAGDVDALVSQWSDDFTVLPPKGDIVRGLAANAAAVDAGREQIRTRLPLEYRIDFEEIEIAGDYAFEWGTYRGSMRTRTGEIASYAGKLMRILKRQADGQWKMHRTMLTIDS
jgi:ketosteroid isomerase-like protein